MLNLTNTTRVSEGMKNNVCRSTGTVPGMEQVPKK